MKLKQTVYVIITRWHQHPDSLSCDPRIEEREAVAWDKENVFVYDPTSLYLPTAFCFLSRSEVFEDYGNAEQQMGWKAEVLRKNGKTVTIGKQS